MNIKIKNIIGYLATGVVTALVCFFILNFFFGPSFTMETYSVVDDGGFPGVNLSFNNRGTVSVEIFDSSDSLIDSDTFYQGSHSTILHLDGYKGSSKSGVYSLKAFDQNDNELFDETLSFDSPSVLLGDCTQYWWERDDWKGGYSLVDLSIMVTNKGDTPIYPYSADVGIDSENIIAYVIPTVVMPGENEHVQIPIYLEDTPEDDSFTVDLKDFDGDILASNIYSFEYDNTVDVESFIWTHGGRRQLKIPYCSYLFEYYNSQDRILENDYALYVFDIYDEHYINMLTSNLMNGFNNENDVARINYVSSFVHSLEYKTDPVTDTSSEYPRYPVETLFDGDGGGDCEDKSILAASILDKLGYNVALILIPNHMAVGVKLDEDTLNYDYYTEDYYFLDVTAGTPVGFIPNDYKSPENLTVEPISNRALVFHDWYDGKVTTYKPSNSDDFVKVKIIVKNLGLADAENILVKCGFYNNYDQVVNTESKKISILPAGDRQEITLTADVPTSGHFRFKTRVYYDGEVVDEIQSASLYP